MDRNFLRALWNLEIYKVNENSIRISQIIIASLVIFTGITLSRKTANIIKVQLTNIKSINERTVRLSQRIVANSMIFLTFLIALPIAGIPMTIFTVLGGAAAIGIGFGMQNLFNNMISSIIIILERPVKVGDIVELVGEKGQVVEVGTRRIKIRRGDGVDVLIPNSFFLEQPLINWTLTDKNIRGKVEVGVAYGADANQVKEILFMISKRNKKVFDTPEPKVLFEDFGDNALHFKLLFWTRINRPLELKELESELRFEIYNEFNKRGIVIAYPQRDIHIDTNKPIDIRMVKNE